MIFLTSEKCKPNYKNVNTVKSFSEQRAATVQVMNRICENEEYLYHETNKLEYLSPPAVRKRFNPVLVDPEKSYGYALADDDVDANEKVIKFTNDTFTEIDIDFCDMSLIDEVNSTCCFEAWEDNTNNFHQRAILPLQSASSVNTDCKNWDLEGVNSAWYVGFDKNKPYQIRPDWLLDHFDGEIPGVCRAQTIEIPDGIGNDVNKSSFLEAVTLKIESQGDTHSDWASPLYVQIWGVESKNVQRTQYVDNQNEVVSGEDTIYVPRGNPYAPLASAVFNPTETTPDIYTFLLDKPIRVNSGEHYAIVILSPLSHWDHAPRVGGWGRNCNVVKDNGGDAFLSEDNGRTWIRYGHNDDSLTWNDYKLGKLTPQDFAFQTHIRVYEDGYDTNNVYYLYLKPIYSSQMKSLSLSKTCYGDASGETDVDLEFQYSLDGKVWSNIPSQLLSFAQDESGEYPNHVFIRAVMSTSQSTITPYIDSIHITIHTELPREMYVRTPFYTPKLTPMLGANLWGRIYAPFQFIPSNADMGCEVEIIQETVSKEHFHIITVDELDQFLELSVDGNPILDSSEFGNSSDTRAEYLIDHPSVITKLKQKNVYIKPYTLDETEYLMSFEDYDDGEKILGGLKLTNSPASPLISVIIQPIGTEKVESYLEHIDFDMDYKNDILTFTKEVLMNMAIGAVSISYNKIFIKDLSQQEVGDRINSETGLTEQGLILDYFKEEILITEELLETRKVPLRVVPIDPLREVKILRGGDEIELNEDIHYTVNYASHKLIFPISNPNTNESQLQLNDTLKVVYTPALEDNGIAIGYRVTRSDLNQQIRIKPNYIEYKT